MTSPRSQSARAGHRPLLAVVVVRPPESSGTLKGELLRHSGIIAARGMVDDLPITDVVPMNVEKTRRTRRRTTNLLRVLRVFVAGAPSL